MSEDAKPALLLLSGGSLVGQNVVEALGDRRPGFRLISTSSRPLHPSLLEFDEVHLVPATADDPGELDRVIGSITAANDISLIIPCRDDDVLLGAEMADRHPHLRGKFAIGPPEVARILSDVEASAAFSRAHDLPFASSCALTSADAVEQFAADVSLPLVIKPRAGFASRSVSIVTELHQMKSLVPNAELVVQEFLGDHRRLAGFVDEVSAGKVPLFHSFEETKTSIQSLISPDGGVTEVFVTRHVMRSGVSLRVDVDQTGAAAELGDRCARAFAEQGWRGPLNIQCLRRPDGRLAIHEYNGRFTGATAARARLGFDEVGRTLDLFAGVRMPAPFAPGAEVSVQKAFVTRSMPKAFEEALVSTRVVPPTGPTQ